MTQSHFQEEPAEVPAAIDRNVEDNGFDWQRAGGSPEAAGDEAAERPGVGDPKSSVPTQTVDGGTPEQA